MGDQPGARSQVSAMWLPGRDSWGFTIIEVLIVVAIFTLLLAIAIPQLSRTRISAREQIALGNLSTARKACEGYFAVNMIYPPDLEALTPPLSTPPYLEGPLTQDPHEQQGYRFEYAQEGSGSSYTFEVIPMVYAQTGIRRYLAVPAGTIYYTDEDRAVDPATDPIL